ncbi:hypothetical protein [Otoolea muris]
MPGMNFQTRSSTPLLKFQ